MNNRIPLSRNLIGFYCFCAVLAGSATASPSFSYSKSGPSGPSRHYGPRGWEIDVERQHDVFRSITSAALLARRHECNPNFRDNRPEKVRPGRSRPDRHADDHASRTRPVTPAVPEPETWALFALGLAGIFGFRGVRKSRAP